MDTSERTNTSPPAYFLAADDTLDMARKRDEIQRTRLRALIIQALLYEPQLLLSDSFAVNNANLRRLFRYDPLVRELANMGLLSVAVRTEDGRRKPLQELRDDFVRQRRHPAEAFDAGEYESSEELEFIDRTCGHVSYKLTDLSQHYSQGVLELLREPANRAALSEPVHTAIVALVNEELEKKAIRQLNYSWFYYLERPNSIGPMLEQRCGPGTLNMVGTKLRQIAIAPYLTALPIAVRANPIYMQTHQVAVDIWRRQQRSEWTALDRPFVFRSRAALSTYVHGLDQIGVEDIVRLRASSEYGQLQSALRSVSTQTAVLDDLNRAHRDYRHRIDDIILNRMGLLPQEDAPPVTIITKLGGFGGEVLHTVVTSAIDAAIPPFPFVGTLIGLGHSLYQHMRGTDAGAAARVKTQLEQLERAKLRIDALDDARAMLEEKSPGAESSRLAWVRSLVGENAHDTVSLDS